RPGGPLGPADARSGPDPLRRGDHRRAGPHHAPSASAGAVFRAATAGGAGAAAGDPGTGPDGASGSAGAGGAGVRRLAAGLVALIAAAGTAGLVRDGGQPESLEPGLALLAATMAYTNEPFAER